MIHMNTDVNLMVENLIQSKSGIIRNVNVNVKSLKKFKELAYRCCSVSNSEFTIVNSHLC